MTDKVTRTFVSTHFDRIQDELREMFYSHGWVPVPDHYPLREAGAFCGRIKLDDGIHCWVNRSLADV
jgi:hypothetical protein